MYLLSFRWRPQIDILMDQLAVIRSRRSQVKRAPTKTTEPKEFSLTKPKAAALPLPELIPQQEKCKPVSFSECTIFPLDIATQIICEPQCVLYIRGNIQIFLDIIDKSVNTMLRL